MIQNVKIEGSCQNNKSFVILLPFNTIKLLMRGRYYFKYDIKQVIILKPHKTSLLYHLILMFHSTHAEVNFIMKFYIISLNWPHSIIDGMQYITFWNIFFNIFQFRNFGRGLKFLPIMRAVITDIIVIGWSSAFSNPQLVLPLEFNMAISKAHDV